MSASNNHSELLQGIVNIPSIEIERQLVESNFSWPSKQETEAGDLILVEERTMVSVYYEMVSTSMQVPGQDEYAKEYLHINEDCLHEFNEKTRCALYHRSRRAWGTFVAEHHLYSMVLESGRYSCKKTVTDDTSGLADMIIKDAYGQFALDIHTGSEHSEGWRAIKAKRHDHKVNIPTIELKLLNNPNYTKIIHNKGRTKIMHIFKLSVLDYIDQWHKKIA
jgi:hypothetical protein